MYACLRECSLCSCDVPQEIGILKSISYDRNIVQFYGASLVGREPMLLLEVIDVSSRSNHAQQLAPSAEEPCELASETLPERLQKKGRGGRVCRAS